MDETFWESHGNEVEAAITIVGAILLAFLVDRYLIGRAVRAAESMETSQISREARTRLSVIRRLISLAIILVGVALALSQFTEIKRLATGLLASTAVLGLILGFAGRTVIANFVAGVTMVIRQPIRIGDLISIGDDVHGRVIDIALTSTTVDKADGSLLVIPNEKVVTEVVINHSAGNLRAPATIELWLEPDADLERARRALEATEVTSVRVAELTPEGCRLELKAAVDSGRDREAREAEIRERAQGALREAGVLRPSNASQA
jgi:small-conductance mechanosensitive channel